MTFIPNPNISLAAVDATVDKMKAKYPDDGAVVLNHLDTKELVEDLLLLLVACLHYRHHLGR